MTFKLPRLHHTADPWVVKRVVSVREAQHLWLLKATALSLLPPASQPQVFPAHKTAAPLMTAQHFFPLPRQMALQAGMEHQVQFTQII